MKSEVILLPPGPLQIERMPDGRRRLLRDLYLRIDGRGVLIPVDFVTDYSSWPRCLPGPAFHRIDLAGVVHDYIFQTGHLGKGGPETGYVKANRIWYKIARAGQQSSAAGPFWAMLGRIGLFIGSWPVWLRYRRAD